MASSSSATMAGSGDLLCPSEKFEDEVNDEASDLIEQGESQDPRIGGNNQLLLGQGQDRVNTSCVGWITLNLLVAIIAISAVLSMYWSGETKAFPMEPVTLVPKGFDSAETIPFVGSSATPTPNEPFDGGEDQVPLVESPAPNEPVASEEEAPLVASPAAVDVGDEQVPLAESQAPNEPVASEEEAPLVASPAAVDVGDEQVPLAESPAPNEPVASEEEALLVEPSAAVDVGDDQVPLVESPASTAPNEPLPSEEEVPLVEEPSAAEVTEGSSLAENLAAAEGTPPGSEVEALAEGSQGIVEAYTYEHAAVAQRQINNFQNFGPAVLLNLIVAHHGGTTVRREFSKFLPCPSFVCIHVQPQDGVGENYPDYYPWSYNKTDENVGIVRGAPFRFLMWQFDQPPQIESSPQIADTDWEDLNLVSMLVIREPISRALAGDALMSPKYPNIIGDTALSADETEWWAFAREERHNNNFALRVLSDSTCCQGADTPRHYLDAAKELVKRFTFVLDINCLEHSLVKLAEILGFEPSHFGDSDTPDRTPAKDRIPFPDVYDHLVEKNKLDIELYEWAKTRALLNCDAVYAAEKQQEEEAALVATQMDATMLPP